MAVFVIIFTGCQVQPSAVIANSEVQNKSFGESAPADKSSIKNTVKNDSAEGTGDIKECNPARLSVGEILKISLRTPNGGNLAIMRDKSKTGFFLLSDEIKSNQDEQANSFWTTDELKNLAQINLDTADASAIDLTNLNTKGKGKPELIFSSEGWYTVEISNESLEQDDAPISGRCRVYFSGKSVAQEQASDKLVLFDFRKESFELEQKLDNQERERVLQSVLRDETDGMEISGKQIGAFTSVNRSQIAYLIRPDITSITQDPTTPAKSFLAIFEGDNLIIKSEVGNYFYIAAKSDTNRDDVDELLLVGNNLQMGIETRSAKLININSNKLQVIKDFGIVYENSCEASAVKKKEIRTSLIKFVVNQNLPMFSSQIITSLCTR